MYVCSSNGGGGTHSEGFHTLPIACLSQWCSTTVHCNHNRGRSCCDHSCITSVHVGTATSSAGTSFPILSSALNLRTWPFCYRYSSRY